MAGPAFGPALAQGAAAGFQGQNLLIDQAIRQIQQQALAGQVQDAETQRQGSGGAYDAIRALFAGGAPPPGVGMPMPQTPAPGAPSVPAQQPAGADVSQMSGFAPGTPGAPQLDPAAAARLRGMGAPDISQMQGAQPAPTAAPGAPSGAFAGGQVPQPGGQQQGSLASIVSVVDRAMPGAPPQAKMAALSQMSGLMNAQAQAQFAQMKHVFDMQMAVATFQQHGQQHADTLADRAQGREDTLADRAQGREDRMSQLGMIQAMIADRARDRNETTMRGQDMRYGNGISPEDTNTLAEAWAAGDHSATAGLTPGDRRAVLSRAAQIARGEPAPGAAPAAEGAPAAPAGTGRNLAANKVALQGEGQAARSGAAQATRISIGAQELKEFAPLLLDASAKVDRTRFPTINSMILATERGAGDENVVRFMSQIQAVKNAYAQVMTRGGATTVDSMHRADEVINKAWSTGQIKAAVGQLELEADAALRAAEHVTTRTKERVATGGKPAAPAQAAPPAAGPAPGAVVGGYRFKGGDPKVKTNWAPVGEGGGASDAEAEGGDGAGEQIAAAPPQPPVIPQGAPGQRVFIRGAGQPSYVDRVYGRAPSLEGWMESLRQARRGAGARDAR